MESQIICIVMKRLQGRCQYFIYYFNKLLFKKHDIYAHEKFLELWKLIKSNKGLFNEERGR